MVDLDEMDGLSIAQLGRRNDFITLVCTLERGDIGVIAVTDCEFKDNRGVQLTEAAIVAYKWCPINKSFKVVPGDEYTFSEMGRGYNNLSKKQHSEYFGKLQWFEENDMPVFHHGGPEGRICDANGVQSVDMLKIFRYPFGVKANGIKPPGYPPWSFSMTFLATFLDDQQMHTALEDCHSQAGVISWLLPALLDHYNAWINAHNRGSRVKRRKV
jgi:hypothetical protein